MVDVVCHGLTFTGVEAIFFDKDGTLEDSRLFLCKLARRRVKAIVTIVPELEEIAANLLLTFGIGDREAPCQSQDREAPCQSQDHAVPWQSQDLCLDPQGLMAVGSYQENKMAAAAYIASRGYSWWESQELAEQAFHQAGRQIVPDLDTAPLFPGCLEVIKSLHDSGLKLGIISADSIQGITSFVERENLGDYFQLLLGSDRDLSKPNPLLYLKACDLLEVDPQNTLMIGDAIGDITMAKQAHAQGTIGITWDAHATHLSSASVTVDNLTAIRLI